MKKTLVWIMILALAATALAGCGSDKGAANPAAPAQT